MVQLSKSETEEILDNVGLSLDHDRKTAFGNLEDFGALDGFTRDDQPDWWVIRQRDGEFVMGDDFPPAVRQERNRAIAHIRSLDPTDSSGSKAAADGGTPPVDDNGRTLRDLVAEEMELEDPFDLEPHLKGGRDYDQRQKLNDVVDIITNSDTFQMPDDFGKIELIPQAKKHHLTEQVREEYDLT